MEESEQENSQIESSQLESWLLLFATGKPPSKVVGVGGYSEGRGKGGRGGEALEQKQRNLIHLSDSQSRLSFCLILTPQLLIPFAPTTLVIKMENDILIQGHASRRGGRSSRGTYSSAKTREDLCGAELA